MMMELEDVIKLLGETHDHMVQQALRPHAETNKQYLNLGIAEGVKMAIKKLQLLNVTAGRDNY